MANGVRVFPLAGLGGRRGGSDVYVDDAERVVLGEVGEEGLLYWHPTGGKTDLFNAI